MRAWALLAVRNPRRIAGNAELECPRCGSFVWLSPHHLSGFEHLCPFCKQFATLPLWPDCWRDL